MRVFHGILNTGSQAGLFSKELRKRGINSIAVTLPDWLYRETDQEFKNGHNLIQKVYAALFNFITKLRLFFSYDIFHFYYGATLLPRQIDLPFYRFFGKKVVMEYLGNDVQGYQVSVNKYKWTNVFFMMSLEEGIIYDQKIARKLNFQNRFIDKKFVCAPLYSEFVPDAQVLPLAIDLQNLLQESLPKFDGIFNIMHAPTDRGFKGTSHIIKAIELLQLDGYSIKFNLVERMSHSQLLKEYKTCHLFIDQIMAGWYGTASVEAMALGRPVIAFIRSEYNEYIDFGAKIPIINANPDTIYKVLKETLDKGIEYLRIKGDESRKFVEEVHDINCVTDTLVKVYRSIK
jgi:glycosyltransferase involved in cell wall biosynthesis